jgi:hypothetical protein
MEGKENRHEFDQFYKDNPILKPAGSQASKARHGARGWVAFADKEADSMRERQKERQVQKQILRFGSG